MGLACKYPFLLSFVFSPSPEPDHRDDSIGDAASPGLQLGSASVVLGLLAHIAESANCYKADGKLQDTKFGWVPCNPDLPSTLCCSGIDYSLDNGLCLNAGVVNNMYTDALTQAGGETVGSTALDRLVRSRKNLLLLRIRRDADIL